MNRLALVKGAPADAGAAALRSMAVALLPYLRELLEGEHRSEDLVDVVASVPAPKRTVMRACRTGAIAGASRVGRRWLAPRASVDKYLQARGPKAVANVSDEDDGLEALRRRIAAGGRR